MSDIQEEIKNLKFTKEALKTVEKLTSNLLQDLETSRNNHKLLQSSTTKLIQNANDINITPQKPKDTDD